MTTRRPLVFYDKKHIWALITKTPAMVQMNSMDNCLYISRFV